MTAVYVFGAILAILLVAVVVAPLVERKGADELEAPATAERRKQRALDALRELEFEHETGKIPEADYLSLRGKLANEAVVARDAIGETGPAAATGRCAVCDAPLKPGAKFCSRCGQAKGAATGV